MKLTHNMLLAIFLVALTPILALANQHTLYLKTGTFDPMTSIPTLEFGRECHLPPSEHGYYIIQFKSLVTETLKDDITDAGAILLDYLPENAFMAWMLHSRVELLRHHQAVRWIGPYQPAFKVAPDLRDNYKSTNERDVSIQYLGVLFDTEDVYKTADYLVSREIDLITIFDDDYQKVIHFEARLSDLDWLSKMTAFQWIQKYPEFRLFNHECTWVVQSNKRNQHTIWNHGLQGEGQIIGVLDSGLDYGSCFFRDSQLSPPGPQHRKVIAYRSYGGDEFDSCPIGHGTHVCGTAAGEDITNGSKSMYNGVAPKAKITFGDIQVASAVNCILGALTFNGGMTQVFQDAYDDGARVHSNSWGEPVNAYNQFSRMVDDFMWENKVFLALFANGNQGPYDSTVSSPATAKNCVSVGATQRNPNQANTAFFSSRGPTTDGRFKPTVCAPGEATESARNLAEARISPTCETMGVITSGTSMACPAVAGAALLTRQYFTEGWYPTGTKNAADAIIPSAALLKAVLVNSCDALTDDTRPNNIQGWGRINLDNTLYFDGDEETLFVRDKRAGIPTGFTEEYVVKIDEPGHPLYVTLVWTDYPAATSASKTLVNDMDLEVIKGSDYYYGNRFQNGWSATAGLKDKTNVEECVFLETTEAGEYTVKVIAANVPNGEFGNQPYALVIRGHFTVDSGVDNPPRAVTDFEAEDTPYDNGGSITLTWTKSFDDGLGENDVDHYTVMRRELPGITYQEIGQVPAGSELYADNSTDDNKQYFFKVRVVDAAGQETDSAPVGPVQSEPNAPLDNPPAKVTNVRASDTSNDSGGAITVRWNVSADDGAGEDDVVSYSIVRRSFGDPDRVVGLVVNGLERYVDSTVTDGEDYYYKVRANDAAGNTSMSSEVGPVQSLDNGYPSVPTQLIAIAGDGFVKLNWTDAPEINVIGYKVYRSPDPVMGYQVIASPARSDFRDPNVTNGDTYYYTVSSVDSNGQESSVSTAVRAMPKAAGEAPLIKMGGYLGSVATSVSGGQVTLIAVVDDPDSAPSELRVELYYQGMGTGVMLNDDGLNGDLSAGDGVFTFQADFPGGLIRQNYLFEVDAADPDGQTANWPYLNVWN